MTQQETKNAARMARSSSTRRLNLYMTEELFQGLEQIAEDKGFRTATEVIQQALRLIMLSYRHESDPTQGLYWREGEDYSRVLLV